LNKVIDALENGRYIRTATARAAKRSFSNNGGIANGGHIDADILDDLIIEAKAAGTGGDNVVFVGDILDVEASSGAFLASSARQSELQVIKIIEEVELASGHRVTAIMGNHEIARLAGQPISKFGLPIDVGDIDNFPEIARFINSRPIAAVDTTRNVVVYHAIPDQLANPALLSRGGSLSASQSYNAVAFRSSGGRVNLDNEFLEAIGISRANTGSVQVFSGHTHVPGGPYMHLRAGRLSGDLAGDSAGVFIIDSPNPQNVDELLGLIR